MSRETRTATIKGHVTPSEREVLDEQARRLGMSISTYIRNVMIHHKLPETAINARAIRDLYKVNADMARLGNLLKIAIDEDKPMEGLQMRIEETRQQLKARIEAL